MTTLPVPGAVIDRLRANLAQAGIRAGDGDIEGMIEKGFLAPVLAFERIEDGIPRTLEPDYLGSWAPYAQTRPAAGISSHAQAQPGRTIPTQSAGLVQGHSSIAGTAARIRRRELSPVELTEAALARIGEVDPRLNAFQLVLAEQALAEARTAEQEIAAGEYRGPLHGIPVAVKDLLAMAGTPTTAGSRILANWMPDFDAAAVERLRASGAVIAGKTRLSEFAYAPASINAHFGVTRNPWQLDHDTGGSSSGSGAAVAAGLVYGALGSDTGGSIRIPAAQCGIVGLKPTFGRVSLYGAIPLSWSLDHVGPMTRTVGDAAIMLEALAGEDTRDPRTRAGSSFVIDQLDGGVRGLRVGVLHEDGSGGPLAESGALEAWQHGLAALEREGAELIELNLPEMETLRILYRVILAQEAMSYHERFLRERLDDYGVFPRQRLLAAYACGPTTFVRAQQGRLAARRRLDAIFETVDLISMPSMPAAAPLLGVPAATTFTGPFNALGWPAITLPVGLSAEGLPFGLQLAGRPWDEATVLRAARVVEAGDR